MNSTPINTATAVGAGAVVAPVVSYIASLFHASLPADVQSAIVVLVVAGAHYMSKVVSARGAAKGVKVAVSGPTSTIPVTIAGGPGSGGQ